MMDRSNGYEGIAGTFIKSRSLAIGGSAVRRWAGTMAPGSAVLDLGCGTGIPVSMALTEEGMMVYGIDASPSLAAEYASNFPGSSIVCEAVEDSAFFGRKFDGIIAWGLVFLLSAESQALLIMQAAMALKAGGRLLFTAPSQPVGWTDIMTGLESRSLGAGKYRELLAASGLLVDEEFTDEGENYYYSAVRIH